MIGIELPAVWELESLGTHSHFCVPKVVLKVTNFESHSIELHGRSLNYKFFFQCWMVFIIYRNMSKISRTNSSWSCLWRWWNNTENLHLKYFPLRTRTNVWKLHYCARIPGLSEEKGRCKKTQAGRRLNDSDYCKSEVWSLLYKVIIIHLNY